MSWQTVLTSESGTADEHSGSSGFRPAREMIAANRGLAQCIGKLETRQRNIGSIIEVLVDEINRVKALPLPTKRKIGFTL